MASGRQIVDAGAAAQADASAPARARCYSYGATARRALFIMMREMINVYLYDMPRDAAARYHDVTRALLFTR